MKYILSIIILFTFLNPVFALDEGFYSAVSLSINSIDKEGLIYEQNDIEGSFTSDVVRNRNMDFLTNDGYRRRAFNHYERVSVPPFSQIDIGYYWYNNTPNTVDVEEIRIPLSREIQSRGDATDIFYDIGFQEGITCSSTLCRGGKYIDFDGVGLLSSNMYKDPKYGIVIGTLTLEPSVEITGYEITDYGGRDCRIKLTVRNNTEESLDKVVINYKSVVSKIIDLQAYEEQSFVVYKECIRSEESINCGKVRIYDSNTKTHCVVYGSSWDNYLRPDSISVFSKINGEWVSGAQTQPEVESFCIKRIPYSYETEDMIVFLQPQVPELTQQEYWQKLLNIQILPITSYKFRLLERYLTLLKPFRIDNLNVL